MSPHVAGTTPYPWPYDGDLTGSGTALLVVVPSEAGGGADLLAAQRIRRPIGLLAAAVHHSGGAVALATTTTPARTGGAGTADDAPQGAPIDELRTGLAPDIVVRAAGIDAFYGSGLDPVLRRRGIARLLLAGVGLETAVHSTMRDANDRGYECLLVVDACAPIDASLVPSAVSMIEMSGGIFGAVARTADVFAALAPRSAADPTPTPAVPTPEGASR